MIDTNTCGLPLDAVRERARHGTVAILPPADSYGPAVYGQTHPVSDAPDRMRLVPPVFTPRRFDLLVELGREPTCRDVDQEARIGGSRSTLPVYLSALASSRVTEPVAMYLDRQAGEFGVPLVIGEDLTARGDHARLMARIETYAKHCPDGFGGVVLQQSTEDADIKLSNRVYSDPLAEELLDAGRLGFELKAGQGAKPGLGGMTLLTAREADALGGRFVLEELTPGPLLRSATPGTFTASVLRGQIRLKRNSFPRARAWVKLPPSRDVGDAARVAWVSGADAVTVDGAEAGTGGAPLTSLEHVRLPLVECLARVEPADDCLLVSGQMEQGVQAVKSLTVGARDVGTDRAAIAAVDAAAQDGLTRLLQCLDLEMHMVISALGKYRPEHLEPEDIWADGGWATGSVAFEFPTGVTIVAPYAGDGTPRGMTCTSLSSVTLAPPTIAVCLRPGSQRLQAVHSSATLGGESRAQCGRGHRGVVRLRGAERFDRFTWQSPTGAGGPHLTAAAHVIADCDIVREVEVGDHAVLFSRVRRFQQAAPGVPLLYGSRRYATWPLGTTGGSPRPLTASASSLCCTTWLPPAMTRPTGRRRKTGRCQRSSRSGCGPGNPCCRMSTRCIHTSTASTPTPGGHADRSGLGTRPPPAGTRAARGDGGPGGVRTRGRGPSVSSQRFPAAGNI